MVGFFVFAFALLRVFVFVGLCEFVTGVRVTLTNTRHNRVTVFLSFLCLPLPNHLSLPFSPIHPFTHFTYYAL